ncbi:hypothetical protein ASD11_16415 [Aeromicrobium sp. Root495]|uniref:hypothetical protein n=1 Tax=Aeromicrobium sp. Root495 TaxID=1736550 RepID=UPI0006F83100|nr:hypothetical protein [Aeromicrobium sp. Root495]KQY56053.1 hypothetical protein ASD11_16415 [Aeromicrobium sp. Root495]
MSGDQLRVDRASIQNHADATRSNAGSAKNINDEVDRQQAHLQRMSEDGVGSEQLSAIRTSTSRHATDIDSGINRTAQKTVEKTDEFVSNVQNAANKSLRNI